MKLTFEAKNLLLACGISLAIWVIIYLIFGWKLVLGLIGGLILAMVVIGSAREKPR